MAVSTVLDDVIWGIFLIKEKEVITVSATRRTRCKIIKSGYRSHGLIRRSKIPTTA